MVTRIQQKRAQIKVIYIRLQPMRQPYVHGMMTQLHSPNSQVCISSLTVVGQTPNQCLYYLAVAAQMVYLITASLIYHPWVGKV